MKQIKKIPSINIPIQKADGSLEWVWYIFFQWLSENSKQTITTGEENGTIAVDGNDVPVKGLGSAAYQSDDDYVHKAGTETITGPKTFTTVISSYSSVLDVDLTPSSTTEMNHLVGFDKNYKLMYYTGSRIVTNGTLITRFGTHRNINGDDIYNEIQLKIAPDGARTSFVNTPPATSSTSDSNIANCGWVNDYTLSTGIVHKAGFEVITDPKAIHTGDGAPIMLRNTDDDSTVAPSTLKASSVGIEDKNGVWQGGWEHYHAEDGNVYKNMAVKQPGANNYAVIQVGITPSGTQWTSAPTPNTNSWDNNIATTAFVKNVLNAIWPVGAIYLSITNYCPLAGIIGTWELIQAGRALWTGNGQTGNYSGVTDKVTAAHNVIWEGLPNITGTTGIYWTERNTSGAFYWDGNVRGGERNDPHGAGNLGFNAAYSNSVYNLGRVQPESYVVNVWRRTA